METRRNLLLAVLMGSVLLSACGAPATPATPTAQPRTAQLSELNNSVNARDTNAQEWGTASEGRVINVSGGVRTGDDARARLDTSEGSIIRIAANTEFELLEFPPELSSPITKLRLEAGKIWIIVAEALGDSDIEIETPNGVATVRGSLMSVEQIQNNGTMQITCLEGACRLRGTSGQFITVPPGQQSDIPAPGQNPTPPQPMTPVQLQDWASNVPEALAAATNLLNQPTPTPPGPSASGIPGASGQIIFPHLAFDAAGVLHLIYETRAARPNGDYAHQQLNAGGQWSAPEIITPEFQFLYGSLQFIAQPSGLLCVAWNGATAGTPDIGVYRKCLVNGAWSTAERLSALSGTARDFVLAYAPNGQLRALYLSSAGTVRFDSHDLNTPEDAVEDIALNGEGLALMAQMVIDAQGTYHAAWMQFGVVGSDPSVVQVRRSVDGGLTWADAETISTPEQAPDGPNLALVTDAQGRVHVLWAGGDGIFYRRWSAVGGWEPAVSVSREPRGGANPKLVVGPNGLARALWWNNDGLRLATQAADGLWQVQTLTTPDKAEHTLIIDVQGQAHAVWVNGETLNYAVVK
ncbi:MAG: FecR domain-containing protein [Anaerolineales bacterium]|nr:FecR domain-containing protein [Anaerolineales bacterium]